MTRLREELAEENQSLLLLATSPLIWAAHFLLSYMTAAIWCAKVAGPAGSLSGVRVAIAIYTVVALSGIGLIGRAAFRRHRFLGFAALLLSALSAVATLYACLVVVFIRSCH
jgi:hypothetical protein